MSGPRSRELLQQLTDADLGNAAFPWLRGREITVAGQPVRALRVSYVGELGWELHPPIESLPALYDAVWDCGRKLGIANYGLYAVNSLRLEKAYKAWSSELTNELNMLEADMERFIRFDKPDFTGKAATLGAAPRPYKIVYAEVAATDTDARGGEPVLVGGPLHRRRHLRRLWTQSPEKFGVRLRRSAIRRCRQPLRPAHPGRTPRRDGARRRGFRSGQCADEGVVGSHGN